MPILPPEPSVYPEDLFEGLSWIPEDDRRWLVLHTRPRAEKALARRFFTRSLPFFLPLYQKRWRCRGRLLNSLLPLFPGYLFLLGNQQARLEALQTNLVAHCLTVEDQVRLHADLIRIHRLLSTGEPVTPEARLRPGDLVEIIDGPMSGLQGKIIRQGRQLRFFVEVDFLQQGASVEIDGWMIRPLADQGVLAATSNP